jgi:NAD(P)-dependent dehydrogenase (short-subunit alcohol dehydrogenase family)
VVTGATGVLGGAIAEGLAAPGAKVAVLGRNTDQGEARVRSIQKQGARHGFFRLTPSTKTRCKLQAKPC